MNVVVSIVLSIYVISSASMMMFYILGWQYGIYFFLSVAHLSFLSIVPSTRLYTFSHPRLLYSCSEISGIDFAKKCQDANNGNTLEIEMHNAPTT